MAVNGIACELTGSPSRRLSDALRDELGLFGTKIGCHAGDCGACTVLLDGEQVCACLVAVGSCEGRDIATVEGLAAADGTLSPLQRAFVAHGAAQCGICTPGMLMAATALLSADPHPGEAEVRGALAGVLCRCTGYTTIVEAVLAVANGGVADAVAPAAGHAVGSRAARLDAKAKVTGAERFGADGWPGDAAATSLAGAAGSTLAMRVVRSPHAHAAFEIGDLAAFRARHPGVVDVLTAADVPNNAFAIFPDLRDQPVLADGVVRFRGEAVLAIVGDAAAVEAIGEGEMPVRFTPLPAVETIDAALDAAAHGKAVQARWPDNVLCRGRVVSGDVDAMLAGGDDPHLQCAAGLASPACSAGSPHAARKPRLAPDPLPRAGEGASHEVTGRFVTRHVEHAYIEPEAGYAEVVLPLPLAGEGRGEGRRIRIFACTQTPYMDRDEIAHILSIAPERVHIVPSAIGGGFGGKLDISVQPLVAVAAWKLGRPVRLVYERPESMCATTKRHPALMRARAACDTQGRLVAYDFHADFDTGAYSSWGPTVANRVPIHASGPYRFASVRALTRAVITNSPVSGAFRGFGVPQSTLLGEALIDELAARAGIDALEFRHLNALRAGDRTATGQLLQASVGLRACLDALRPAWRDTRAAAASFNAGSAAGPLRRGAGIACMWYGIGNTVIANPSTMRGALRCTAGRGAHLFLYNGAQEIGQGAATVMPQIFADAVGLPLACVEQINGDTDLTADAGKSSASRQTFVSGNAARAAGEALRARLLATLGLDDLAAEEVDLRLDDVYLLATHRGVQYGIDLRELPGDRNGDLFTASGHFNPPTVPLDADGQGVPYATYGFAAQIAEVEVDIELGTVKLLKVHAAHDVGRAVNPTLVEGQIHGGIAQGIGMALMEEYVSGRTDNLHDYLIPTVGDVPPIEVHLIEDPEPLGPWGAKGVGEPALVATAPAILAAIHAATGVRMWEVPVTPSRLRAALLSSPSPACGRGLE